MVPASDNFPKILFIRHGETEWNRIGRSQGSLDSALTDKGEIQARQLGNILRRHIAATENYDHFVSPLGRALATAKIISDVISFSPVVDLRLSELHLGKLGGLTLNEMTTRFPGYMSGKSGMEWFFGAPSGETFEQAHARAVDWLVSLERPTIAIGHGQMGKIIRGVVLGLDRSETIALGEPQGVVHKLENASETFLV